MVFLIALSWIFLLTTLFRGHAPGGLYFVPWSSESLMHVVSVRELRAEPFRSLWYNHIQPPALDAIRDALVALSPDAEGEDLIRRVDVGLFALWMALYASTGTLMFSWLRRARSLLCGAMAFGLFLALPGPIFYATILDSTLLSSTLILWFFMALWRLRQREAVEGQLVLCVIALFLTRSVFQWPFLLVLGASFWLMRTRAVAARSVLLPVSVFMMAFLGKQFLLFGLTLTSSFGPHNLCRGLGERCPGTATVMLPSITDSANALVLREPFKLNGEYNFNQVAYLKTAFARMEESKTLILRLGPKQALRALRDNARIFFAPTSSYWPHALVDRLPWRESLDWLFSGKRLLFLLTLGSAAWVWRCVGPGREARVPALREGLGMALPLIYVAAVCILFESGENMRFRYFLEPTLFVYLWLQAWPPRRDSIYRPIQT